MSLFVISWPSRAEEASAGGRDDGFADEFRERAERAWKWEQVFKKRFGVSRNEMFRRAMSVGAKEREKKRARRNPLAGGPAWISLGPSYAPPSATGAGIRTEAPSDSGLVNAIAIHPTDAKTVFIGPAGGGVWRTKDGGITWAPLTDDVGTTAIGAIAIAPSDPRRIYAGCGSGRQSLGAQPPGPGLLVSMDGGETWKLTTSSPGGEFWFLWVSPSDPRTIFAGTEKGLFRSTNGGDTWTKPFDTGGAWATAFAQQPGSPSVLLASTFTSAFLAGEAFQGGVCAPLDSAHPVMPGRLFKSTDGGATWLEKQNLPGGDPQVKRSRIELAFAPSAPSVLYALISRSSVDTNGCATAATGVLGLVYDVAKSQDAGETWTGLGAAPALTPILQVSPSSAQMEYDSVISVDPRDANAVWVGGIDLGRSSDGGTTWQRVSQYYTSDASVPFVHPDQQFHAWAPDGSTLYIGNDGGILSTSDGGASIRDLNRGVVSLQFNTVCQTPAAPDQVAGGTQDNGTILTKGGGSWVKAIGGDGNECAIHPANPDSIIGSLQGNTYYRTANGGTTWRRSSIAATGPLDSVSDFPVLRAHPSAPQHLYTATTLKLYDSSDGGETWTQRSGVIPGTNLIHDFAFFPGDALRMVMGVDGGGVLVSTDGGTSWTKVGATPVAGLACVRFDRTDPNRIFGTSQRADPGIEHVFASTDGGKTWVSISHTGQPNGLPDVPVTQVEQDPNDRNVLVAVTYVGVYRTGDGGATWQRFGTGLPNVWTRQISILPDGSKMRLATYGRGMWEISLVTLPPDQPPTAAIDVPASTPTLDAGIAAAFHGVAADPDAGDVLTSTWDFGDGAPMASGVSPLHSFAVPGTYTVTFRVTDQAGLSATATRTVNVRIPQGSVATGPELLLPVVLDVAGAGGTHYTTELTLLSRAATPTTILLQYTGSQGGGSGYASVTLQPGEVRLIPDAISFLLASGLPLSSDGARIGTLRAVFPGALASEIFIGGRTSTPGAGGTFGLFYAGAATSSTTATIFGLQQNAAQRSNLALVNAGPDAVTLKVQLQGQNGESLSSPGDVALSGYGWTQINQPLLGQAVSGRAVVTKLSGTSPFTAYGVLNDAVTSDGSFVPPILPGDPSGADRLVPIVLSASGYQSEITFTNFTSQPLPLTLTYAGSPQLSSSGSGAVALTLAAGEQRIQSDAMGFLRSLGLPIPSSGNVGGALLVKAPAGTPASSLAVGARTFTNATGGGTFGLFYPGLTLSESASDAAYVNGLQQNAVQRSNLAVVNRGDAADTLTLRVTYFGADGAVLASPDTATLAPGEWRQFNQPLASRGAAAGFAKIERLSGTSRFVAYGILNDQHNSDGSYLPMSR